MDARTRFKRTRRAIDRLDEVHALIMYDCDDWKPPGIKAHNEQSDPTASRAIYTVDELGVKLEALRAEERELEQLIGESLAIISAVRVGFGEQYADVLEARYVDGDKWCDVAGLFDVTERTVQNWARVAFDWVDSVGVSKLLRGQTEL